MTQREQKILKAVLAFLHALDRAQATDLVIAANAFGEAFGTPKPSVGELAAVLAMCDAQGFVTGVAARFGGKMKWSISDAGEAALLEL
jgi:hypothetical protein